MPFDTGKTVAPATLGEVLKASPNSPVIAQGVVEGEQRNALRDAANRTVQMLARVGYAQGAKPSPRRELNTMIKT